MSGLCKETDCETKYCVKCNAFKPVIGFTKDRTRKDGLYPICKDCRKPLQAAYVRSTAKKPKDLLVEKSCSACKEVKPASEFPKHSQTKDGHHHCCKTCHNAKSQVLRYQRTYGFTREQAEDFAKNNVGPCEICGAVGKLHVDHCHKTGNVRGFLCMGCNVALGFMKDDPEILLMAAKYLTVSQSK